MRPVRILPVAQEELDAAIGWYNEERPGVGTLLINEFERALRRIEELPFAAPPVRGSLRRRPILRFPYYILYDVADQEITILAVAHRRRRPGFWSDRS